ncbi:DUF7948 domain-containing protein [Pseudochryseolinea flava]|uniref:PKD domain-containing protein n=1 Tax=Pseudochryseolinea flava TaxID=2059302 RepID=A0A364XZW7_9BACT|nr:gliding motility-associated C-terminal domain-containing protein [Pseudochryseolinea flava]RAV99550.1 hypothetical protein DQQ10_18280 [Pseudochryseolinea flava]
MRGLTAVFLVLVLRVYGGTDPGLQFIENKNQWPSRVAYSARIPSGRMNIEQGRFVYCFIDERKLLEAHRHGHEGDELPHATTDHIEANTIFVDFIGSNPKAVPTPFGKSQTNYNYFIGDDPKRWASRAHAYQGIYYANFYDGVSLKVYSEGNNAKYDFIIAPNADTKQISFTYSGANKIQFDGDDINVVVNLATIIEKSPIAFQFVDGKKVNVKCKFKVSGNVVSFQFPNGYDPCYELVIDPLLIFSTFSGSNADNWGSTATPGERGTLYSSGITVSNNPEILFPATPGAFQTASGGFYDVSILKYDSAGTKLLYASYLGGAAGESSHSLVMNADEDLIVLGTTSSANFPTTASAFDETFSKGQAMNSIFSFQFGSNIFLARISSDGSSLLASTYVGGEADDATNDGQNRFGGALIKNYGDQMRGDVITYENNNIYVCSVTESPDFPVRSALDITYNGGASDAVVFKMNAALTTMEWCTFLGGGGADAAYSIKLDSKKGIYVAGGTTSANFPTSGTAYQKQNEGGVDGWIAHLSPDGKTLQHATYTGTSSYDQIYFVDLDELDNVYVYGQTEGDFPVSAGVYSNPNSAQFIQKFDSQLTNYIFSTVFGSGERIPNISPTAFAVNQCNYIYLAGWGGGVNVVRNYVLNDVADMPITPDAWQDETVLGADFYFMVLDDNAKELLYATYMGGDESFTHVDGGTSRFDKSGVVYHAVCGGCGGSSDFPTTAGAWSRQNKSNNCNNAAFKFDLTLLRARIQSNAVDLSSPGLAVVCIPDGFVFQNKSYGGEIFEWNLGDGTVFTKSDSSMIEPHYYDTPGTYRVTMRAVDRGTCIGEDADTVFVKVYEKEARIPDDDVICSGTSHVLEASGAAFYEWRVGKDVISNNPRIVVSPTDSTAYIIKVTEVLGCSYLDTVSVGVIQSIEPSFSLDRQWSCEANLPIIELMNTTEHTMPGDILYFDLGDGQTSTDDVLNHYYEKEAVYTVKLVGAREFCVSEKIETVPVFSLLFPNVITPGIKEGKNDALRIRFGASGDKTPTDFGFPVAIKIFNRWGEKVFESDDYQHDWSGENLSTGVYYYEAKVMGHSTCRTWVHLKKE